MYVNELNIWFIARTGTKLHLAKSIYVHGSVVSLCGGILKLVPATNEDIESQSVCSQCISKANHKGVRVRNATH